MNKPLQWFLTIVVMGFISGMHLTPLLMFMFGTQSEFSMNAGIFITSFSFAIFTAFIGRILAPVKSRKGSIVVFVIVPLLWGLLYATVVWLRRFGGSIEAGWFACALLGSAVGTFVRFNKKNQPNKSTTDQRASRVADC